MMDGQSVFERYQSLLSCLVTHSNYEWLREEFNYRVTGNWCAVCMLFSLHKLCCELVPTKEILGTLAIALISF